MPDTLAHDLRQHFRGAWALVRGSPWLPAAAIAGEAVQHAVEFDFGMYVRSDGISPGAEMNLRMLAAAIKVAGFLVTLFLTARAARNAPGATLPQGQVVLLAILAPIASHYALNYLAFDRPPGLVAPMLAIDTLVIGWLAMTIGIVLPRRGGG